MSIQNITPDDLRQMQDQEALILQGCGGDPREWLDGINDLFTSEGILLNGTRFQEAPEASCWEIPILLPSRSTTTLTSISLFFSDVSRKGRWH